jgi:protein-tyrosine phosphatase
VQDYGVPGDAAAFADFVAGLAALLRAGEGVAIHCAGGVGRTGLTALCLLTALGLDADAARARVEAAGSHPETDAQAAFVAAFALRCV